MTTRDREDLAKEIHALGGRLTSAVSALHGLVVNECLATQTLILDADGTKSRNWTVPYGSISVHNAGAGTLTITTSPLAGAAPTSGVGVIVVPSGIAEVANVAGRTLSFYGTPGAAVILSVFTKPQPPAWGNLGVLVSGP
jgi:hypothetical protein